MFVIASLDSNYVFVINKGDGTNPGSLSIITTSNDQVANTPVQAFRSPISTPICFVCTSLIPAATR